MAENGNAAAPAPSLFNVDPAADPVGAFNELRTAHTNLLGHIQNTVNDIQNVTNTLTNQITNLAASVNPAPAAPNPAPAASNPPAPPVPNQTIAAHRAIKGARLEQFSGKVQDVERFLQDLRDDIELQGAVFTSDRQKSLYMTTFLRDTQMAHDWVAGTRRAHPDLLDDFSAFTISFEKHFGASNKVDEALRKLRQLKQTGSAASYAARFHEISAALPQETFFLSNMFFDGLKQEVQKWIYQLPDGKGSTLDALISRAIDGDNRLHEWSRTNKTSPSSSTRPPASSHTSTTTSTTSQTTTGPVPMDLSATRTLRPPLDQTEKERRKSNGLCGYCGGSHAIDSCQLLKEKNDRKTKGSGKANPRA